MFTGLVEKNGRINSIEKRGDGLRLTLAVEDFLQDVKIGDSIAVDGICLTVVDVSGNTFTVDAVSETVQRTTLAVKKMGQQVNLEKAMAAGDRFGGHFVQGHIDGVGKIAAIQKKEPGYWMIIHVPSELMDYIIEKGSIAIDGLSLTVAAVSQNDISIAIIPHTWSATTLHQKRPGDAVNIETDMIAKYIAKMVRPHQKNDELSLDKLADFGFE